MLKTMKYELIKNKIAIFVILAIMALTEVAFVYTNYFNFDYVTLPIMVLVIMGIVAGVWIFVNGITMFDRDFKNKSGFLVYMTPQPAGKIITAKILVVYLTGIVFFIGYFLLGILDIRMVLSAGTDVFSDNEIDILTSFISSFIGTDTYISMIELICSVAIVIFGYLTAAYLSISLGNTVLRGKKLQGLISFVVFLILIFAIAYIRNYLFGGMGDYEVTMGDNGLVFGSENFFSLATVPRYIYDIAVGVLEIIASAFLIEKKIDL